MKFQNHSSFFKQTDERSKAICPSTFSNAGTSCLSETDRSRVATLLPNVFTRLRLRVVPP